MPGSPPPDHDALDLRLNKLRVQIDMQIDCLEAHLGIMRIYRYLEDDEGLSRAMGETRDRMRGALALVARLDQEKREAAMSGLAAIEFRASRDRRRP